MFRNHRGWKDSLRSHAIATGIKPVTLTIDILVRWNSIYYMLQNALLMEAPITALYASQTLDTRMRDIQITSCPYRFLRDL